MKDPLFTRLFCGAVIVFVLWLSAATFLTLGGCSTAQQWQTRMPNTSQPEYVRICKQFGSKMYDQYDRECKR